MVVKTNIGTYFNPDNISYAYVQDIFNNDDHYVAVVVLPSGKVYAISEQFVIKENAQKELDRLMEVKNV